MGLLQEIRDQIVNSGQYTATDQYEMLLHKFQYHEDDVIALRLIWECGMSVEEICTIYKKNAKKYDLTIQIFPDRYVPTRAARTVFVKDDSIIDLLNENIKSSRWDSLSNSDNEKQKYQDPVSYMRELSQKIRKLSGLKINQRSLMRGKFVEMVDNGTKDLYDIIRFFGSENLAKMGIIRILSAESEEVTDGK